jgi:NarL family two-component system response regulator LiaR
MTEQRIKVLIVDDHAVVRKGLRTFLELVNDLEVIGEAENGAMAIERAQELKPEVILMDLMMPVMDGISAIGQLCKNEPRPKIIALTSFLEDEQVIPAIQAGATSFLLKDVTPEDLVDAIRAAFRGEVRLHPDVARKLMEKVTEKSLNPTEGPGKLTIRENEVLELVSTGASNKEIAGKLVISEKTVKTHISSLLGKLNLKDRTQLAIFALKHKP